MRLLVCVTYAEDQVQCSAVISADASSATGATITEMGCASNVITEKCIQNRSHFRLIKIIYSGFFQRYLLGREYQTV